MHHIVLGHRPDAARPGAVHPGQRPRRSARPALDLGLDVSERARYVGPCIAGHVGADTAAAMLAEGPHRGERMAAAGRRRHQRRDRPGRPRDRQFAASSPTGPGVRGRPDLVRAAGDRRRHRSACASIARRSAPRVKVIGCRSVERRSGVRRGDRGPGDQRRVRLGDHRSDRRDVPRRGDRRRRCRARRDWRRTARTSSPTTARSATCCLRTRLGRAVDHPERRARRSSWPRLRCAPASIC